MLEAAGIPVNGGPIAVMLEEHEMGRRWLGIVRNNLPAAKSGSPEACASIRMALAEYTGLLRRHIWKEDNVLFEMAKARLNSDAEISRMKDLFAEEEAASGLRKRYEAILSQFTDAAVY